MNGPPRVLVVSHEATRTGAPKVAVDLLRQLGAHGWDTTVVHRWGGPLERELDAAARAARWQPLTHLRHALRRRPATTALARRVDGWGFGRVLGQVAPDLVWCNTVATLPAALQAAGRGIPTVLHSHEQADWIDHVIASLPPGTLAGISLVGCSTDTAALLAAAAKVPAEAVAVLPSAVDVAALAPLRTESRTDGDDDQPLVIAACGTGDARKGVDVFTAAARIGAAQGLAARWRWIGRPAPDHAEHPEVEWVGEVPSAAAEIAGADVFALTSRADSFPLVVLEAMALGRAVVATELAGPAEQLGGAGVLVPVGDPDALVAAVAVLAADPEARDRLGTAALDRAAERWDVAVFGATADQIGRAAISARRVAG